MASLYRHIVIMGPPGSGKGTQSAVLTEKIGLYNISTGDLLRQVSAEDTPLGHEVKGLIDKGNFVPDETIVKVMQEQLAKIPEEKGYILDGFPRTLPQAKALDEMMASQMPGRGLDLVLFLQVPDAYVIERIIGRSKCAHCGALYHERYKQPKVFGICDVCGHKEFERREDDTYETVLLRLQKYRKLTEPVIPYYEDKGLLVCIDGVGPIDVVAEKIRQVVGY